MMTILARFISFVTNPVFIIFPAPFLLVYKETNDTLYAFKWMVFSALFIVIVGLFVLYEVHERVFSDMDVSKREQRPLLFFFVSFVALIYFISLFVLDAPTILYVAIGGIIGSIVVLSLINQKVKASIHVATISAFFSVLSLLYGGVHLLWFALIPLVAWSRLKINRHTYREVVVGAILGIILPIAVYVLVKLLLFYLP